MAATVQRVSTAQQLASAIKAGVEHIEVDEHLDLRQLPQQEQCPNRLCSETAHLLVQATTVSVVV